MMIPQKKYDEGKLILNKQSNLQEMMFHGHCQFSFIGMSQLVNFIFLDCFTAEERRFRGCQHSFTRTSYTSLTHSRITPLKLTIMYRGLLETNLWNACSATSNNPLIQGSLSPSKPTMHS